MKDGYYTGKLGLKLFEKYKDTKYSVYYEHPDERDEPNACRPQTFMNKCSNATSLSWPDIVFLNEERNQVELIIEIEEKGAEPKKVIGDIGSVVLSDQIRITEAKEKDYDFGNLTFIMAAKVNPDGSGGEKIELICKRMLELNEELSKREMEIIPIVDGDINELMMKIETKIDEIV